MSTKRMKLRKIDKALDKCLGCGKRLSEIKEFNGYKYKKQIVSGFTKRD